MPYLEHLFACGIETLGHLVKNSDYEPVLVNLPKAQIIVLIFAFKKAQRYSLFNFEAVYQMYKNFMKSHQQQMDVSVISRAQFLKLFLDLIDKGFLVSESDMDILNVNTKCGLQIPKMDMQLMLSQK